VFQEAVERMRRGDIGNIAMAQVFYYANRPWTDRSSPDMDAGLKRMVNCIGDRVLSGDVIVERNIHVLDMANWYLDGHPLKATGAFGRTSWAGTKSDAGDAWDHFAVTFWYPNEVHVTFSSHQLTGTFSDLCVRCFGLHGSADTHYGGLVRILSDDPARTWTGAQKDDTFTGRRVTNVKDFIASIRAGKPINNAPTAVESNFTAILGIPYPGEILDALTKIAQYIEEGPGDRLYLIQRIGLLLYGLAIFVMSWIAQFLARLFLFPIYRRLAKGRVPLSRMDRGR